jgi:hypothetical protein
MSMGHGANYADVVDEKFVQDTCPKELEAFLTAVEDHDSVDLENVAHDLELGDDNGYLTPKIKRTYKALVKAFNKKTGLVLGIGYHSIEDNGDRYDDINGVYWSVGGVWTRTPAGKKHQAKITRSFFVTCG